MSDPSYGFATLQIHAWSRVAVVRPTEMLQDAGMSGLWELRGSGG